MLDGIKQLLELLSNFFFTIIDIVVGGFHAIGSALEFIFVLFNFAALFQGSQAYAFLPSVVVVAFGVVIGCLVVRVLIDIFI